MAIKPFGDSGALCEYNKTMASPGKKKYLYGCPRNVLHGVHEDGWTLGNPPRTRDHILNIHGQVWIL